MSSPQPGVTIGRYLIRSKLGAGGMGEVYRAHDEKLKRDVALKVLPSAFSQDLDRLLRFEQEAQAAGALNHPNILAVHDVGMNNGSPYIVSELLDGEELRDQLKDGALTQRKALDYAKQIAEGLAAAHERGITHRDLKPENLFITSAGRVKILDFGLAKLRPQRNEVISSEVATQKQITDPGTVMGTSPDGRWMAYVSDESGREEIYLRAYPQPGTRIQISAEGGTAPVWSRNSRELFFRNGDQIFGVSITLGSQPVAGKTSGAVFKIDCGRCQWSSLQHYRRLRHLTPDGRHFVMPKYTVEANKTPNAIVILNWLEELKRKVSAGK
jgi:serine/threonine protein kinase